MSAAESENVNTTQLPEDRDQDQRIEEAPCPNCHDSGYIWYMCEWCEMQGIVLVPCKTCGGASSDGCDGCGGMGEIERKCRTCDGMGETPQRCPCGVIRGRPLERGVRYW